LLNVIEGYPVAEFTCDELLKMGFSIVGYSGFVQRAAMKAMADVSALFLQERTTERSVRNLVMSTSDRNAILKVQSYQDLEASLLSH
jgi:2-methylisocitrate lyase-like PEP mutase family enzyme